jgi:sugar/nucleoside kinase (ribokinase family)
MKNNSIDFLAVGDIVIDAFIELQDAKIHCDIDDNNCTISMNFGDKIPYKKLNVVSGVGNAPNASVCTSRLGLTSACVTHVGDDQHGKDCIDNLQKNSVDTSLIQIQKGFDTNYHFVMSFDAERTILIKHAEFNYDFPSIVENMRAPKWIYFSSVASNSLHYHEQIVDYLQKNPTTKLAFQPGTFQISLGSEKLKELYKQTEVFFCNKEESQKILKTDDSDTLTLLQKMHKLGPNIVCITDGPKGAYAYDGTNAWFQPIYPDPAPPVERTGAGDSFSSTFTAALALGKSVPEALSWGPINSMNVVQHIGAQEGLLSKKELEEYLENAPEDYKTQKIR